MLVENYSNSRQVNPVGFLAIFEKVQTFIREASWKLRSLSARTYQAIAGAWLFKLTWLALGEDQVARSRRVEQLTAL